MSEAVGERVKRLAASRVVALRDLDPEHRVGGKFEVEGGRVRWRGESVR